MQDGLLDEKKYKGEPLIFLLKVNYAGVIPVIFASSLLMFPATIGTFIGQGNWIGDMAIGLPIEELQSLIRDVPKPVIARVQGYAIGGGNVLATLCDLTIASDKAQFGQVGPKVGSVDPGFGTAYLARVVGEKKAREIWYLNRRYTAAEARDMGLVNAVVPHDRLDAEIARWCAEIMERSPRAIAIAKRSFNADCRKHSRHWQHGDAGAVDVLCQ